MQDFERADRGAGHISAVSASAFDKRVAYVDEPPRLRRRWVSAAGSLSSYSDPGPWSSRDSEAKRRRRVASYKAYGVESKMKDAVRRGLRWIKVRCSNLVQGR